MEGAFEELLAVVAASAKAYPGRNVVTASLFADALARIAIEFPAPLTSPGDRHRPTSRPQRLRPVAAFQDNHQDAHALSQPSL